MNNYSLVETVEIITRAISDIESEIIDQNELKNLSMKQIHYLEIITRLGNPTLSEIADALKITKPSVTAIVEKLANQKYLKKVQSDEDRRAFHVHVTKKGVRVSKLHDDVHRLLVDSFQKALSVAELKKLTSLLNKIVEYIE